MQSHRKENVRTSFSSPVWAAQTPSRMRAGGSAADYRVLTGDFNGDGTTDIATLSPNAAGDWSIWMALELSTGSGFDSPAWAAQTPTRMRSQSN